MKTYTTKQGDLYDTISYRVYGDEGYAGQLMEANPAHVNTVIFPAGVQLNVPAVSKETSSQNLPPWRRRASNG